MINFNNIDGINRAQSVKNNAYQSYSNNNRRSGMPVRNSRMQPDEVILSNESTERKVQIQKINDAPLGTARNEKVEELAQSVRSNTYAVNAYDVASKFIASQKN